MLSRSMWLYTLWRGKGSEVRKTTRTFALGEDEGGKEGGCTARGVAPHGKQRHSNPKGLTAEPTSKFLTL